MLDGPQHTLASPGNHTLYLAVSETQSSSAVGLDPRCCPNNTKDIGVCLVLKPPLPYHSPPRRTTFCLTLKYTASFTVSPKDIRSDGDRDGAGRGPCEAGQRGGGTGRLDRSKPRDSQTTEKTTTRVLPHPPTPNPPSSKIRKRNKEKKICGGNRTGSRVRNCPRRWRPLSTLQRRSTRKFPVLSP